MTYDHHATEGQATAASSEPLRVSELMDRISAATGEDREIDAALMALFHYRGWAKIGVYDTGLRRYIKSRVWKDRQTKQWVSTAPHHFTGSMDAALKLIRRAFDCRLIDVTIGIETDPAAWPATTIRWYQPGRSGKDWWASVEGASTPALAMCKAAVAALKMAEADGASRQDETPDAATRSNAERRDDL